MVVVAALLTTAAASQNALVRARQLYNQLQYDAAIAAAQEARRRPDLADAAGVVLARAHLERYRHTNDAADLMVARDTLAQIDPGRLSPRDRSEWVMGLGEFLYFDGRYGAAAETFDAVLGHIGAADPASRDRVLHWWALAVDRQAHAAADAERRRLYARMLDRMEAVLRANSESAAAPYWLAVAAAGIDDLDRAWDAAVAAWVRAPMTGARSASLRADLDHLVQELIIPERVRRAPTGDSVKRAAALRAEWETIKQAWTRR